MNGSAVEYTIREANLICINGSDFYGDWVGMELEEPATRRIFRFRRKAKVLQGNTINGWRELKKITRRGDEAVIV